MSGVAVSTKSVKDALNNLFQNFDIDKNGYLNEDEINAMVTELNVSSGINANIPEDNVARDILNKMENKERLEKNEFVENLFKKIKERTPENSAKDGYDLFLESLKIEVQKKLRGQ